MRPRYIGRLVTTRTTDCPRCGKPLQPGARFCPSCGSDTSGDQTAVATKKVDSASAMLAKADAGLIDALRRATLGEYEIMGLLGRGGMATVYLAHDIALDRKVAIKVMSPYLMSGEGMAERFKREARTAGSLSHPNIIPIYAVKEAGDLLFFVMKFVEGRPLDGIIREVGAVPFPMAQTIMQQVGSALGYAHRRGIIHRDIKPANIMLDVDGWAMVTDFGIAKVSDKQGLTMTGATVGTPSYMSPEQCAATKELTQASDQYSLGIVAYEMLAGRLPFTADTVMAIMYAHFNEPPPPIQSIRADCPPEIATAVMRMLEKDPDKRWPSAEAAVAAFGQVTLAPDDPVRTQMVTLATKGGTSQLVAKFSTPPSPTPAGRSVKHPKGIGPHSDPSSTSGGVIGLTLTPAQVTVAVGGAVQITARPKRASGATLFGRVITWATTDHDVATVSHDGLVTALTPGTATITCTCEGASATANVIVSGHKQSRALAYVMGLIVVGLVGAGVWLFGPWNKPVTSPPAAPTSIATQPPAPPPQQQAVVPPPATQPVAPPNRPANRSGNERTQRTGKVAAAPPPAPPPAPTSVTTNPPGVPVVVTQPVPPPAPPPAPPAAPENPRPLIEASIQAYARALESRDVQQVRRSYPGLTPQQAQVWRDFFGMVSELKVDLAIKQLQITGEVAEAQVEGTSQFMQNRRQQQQPMSFHATLDRSSGTWRIGSIR
jgi:serine/threonine-protein kinase